MIARAVLRNHLLLGFTERACRGGPDPEGSYPTMVQLAEPASMGGLADEELSFAWLGSPVS